MSGYKLRSENWIVFINYVYFLFYRNYLNFVIEELKNFYKYVFYIFRCNFFKNKNFNIFLIILNCVIIDYKEISVIFCLIIC